MTEIDKIKQLITQEGIIGQTGVITFNYAGLQSPVFSKDIIGNTLQDWFGQWLKSKGMVWEAGVHSQSWPDFILNDGTHLEVKTFYAPKSPNFDLANFDSFVDSLWEGNVHRLDTDHLVFSYITNPITGFISINDFWIKKIWELTGPSDTNILNLQVKYESANNIRPKNWRNPSLELFTSRKEFVYALSQAVIRFSPNKYLGWYNVVSEHYYNKFGCEL